MPTIQSDITKTESIAQTNDENSTKAKTKTNDDSDGDYVCLDIRSTANVPQIPSSTNVKHTLPKKSQTNDPSVRQSSDAYKSDFVPQTQLDATSTTVSSLTQMVTKGSSGAEVSAGKPHTLASNKLVTSTPIASSKTAKDQSDWPPLQENQSENSSQGSSSGSRPSSVSSNKELYYASLDLPAASSSVAVPEPKDEHKALSVATMIAGCGNQELLYSSADTNQLSYAQIDFGIDKKNSKS